MCVCNIYGSLSFTFKIGYRVCEFKCDFHLNVLEFSLKRVKVNTITQIKVCFPCYNDVGCG